VFMDYNSDNVPAQRDIKMQFAFDNHKKVSEWIMVCDGKGNQVISDSSSCLQIFLNAFLYRADCLPAQFWRVGA
jgi:hypothetical protein